MPIGSGAAALTGVEAAVAAALIRRAVGEVALDRLSHTLALVLVAIAVPMVGGTVAGLIIPDSPALVSRWFAWWLAETAGMLVAAPVVLIALSGRRPAAGLGRLNSLEVIVVTVVALLLVIGIFGGGMPSPLRVPAFVLPFLIWPAIRFGIGPASVTVFTVTFLVLQLARDGQMPLAMLGDGNLLMRAQGGIIVAAGSVLLLGSIVSERKRVAAERDELVARLQQALTEIKTLRGLIPICAWCHKVRDDAGFWKEIEHYLDEHTDATFSHGICPHCVAEHESEIAEHEAAARTPVA
jgi:integral membrane sensor domain MASE1